MQREISDEINSKVAEKAKSKGIKVILDVGGQDIPLGKNLLKHVSIVSPNETELKRIISEPFDLEDDNSMINICNLMRKENENPELEFLIKLGSKGAMFIDVKNQITKQKAFYIESMPIVDTTGAGDCFTGSFSFKYSAFYRNGETNIQECLKFATAAAYKAITKFGASTAPNLEEVNEVLKIIS